ncbi:helix-turn-helix transcriptional regulator [Micromonospora haikouensis]|uniref:helix-turn-helix domain-containing protein n=1 Tax=Micromonospora haikouensis TaxID=686309 RepID=UPI00342D0165
MSSAWQASDMSIIVALTSAYSDPVAAEEESGQRFAQLLRQHRAKLRLRQEDVAERSGVSLRTISRWETGQVRNPKPEELQAVCRVLGLSTVTATTALGYLAPEDTEHLPEPPPLLAPDVEEAIAILNDPLMSDAARYGALEYLRFLLSKANAVNETPETGTSRPRAS